MKTTAALLAAVLGLAACAGEKPKPTQVCQSTPQWITTDGQGRPQNAVYVCFGSDNAVRYEARPLTAAEIEAMAPKPAPPVVAEQAPAAPVKKTPKTKASAKTAKR